MSNSLRKLYEEARKALGWDADREPRKIWNMGIDGHTPHFVYEIPERAGAILDMSATEDRRYLIIDCTKAVVKIETATDKVELLMLEET